MADDLSGVRALLAWDGRAYVGWQVQPDVETVQGVVEDVVARLMNGERVMVRAVGRLDAGVHASGQVVGFDVPASRTVRELYRGLNGLLPPDISCLAMSAAPAGFDPRKHNRGKVYRYRFMVREARCPFRWGQTWHIGKPLDVPAMQAAALSLVGRHDFTSFRSAGCTARHPVRGVRSVRVEDRGDEVHLVVDGEAFLRHQVRIIAGCLIEVGLGRHPVRWISEVLYRRDRSHVGITAPAQGLVLETVIFRPPLTWEQGRESVVQW